MHSTTFAAAAVFISAVQLVAGQTFTDCDPTKKSCPSEPALGGVLTTDFTKGKSADWELATGTSLTYDPALGAEFVIGKPNDAPTIGTNKYIMFGKVEVTMRASAGTGTVSSFILESADLDEIDWEWLGSNNGNVQSNFFGKGNTTTYDRAVYHPVNDPINTFHTYTIDWNADSLKWFIDGTLVRTLLYGDALALGGKNYPQTPMKVKMGNWIGCADVAATTDPKSQGTCQWAGGPINLDAGPYTMYVKSVTIQDYGCASEYSYSDMSGSWQSIVASGECNGAAVSSKPSPAVSSKTTPPPSKTTPVASSTSTSPAILIETHTSHNTTSTKATTKASSTGNSTTPATTLATATGSAGSATTPAASGSSTTTGIPAQVSGNAGSTVMPKKYGAIDAAVLALGLGMGYLFM